MYLGAETARDPDRGCCKTCKGSCWASFKDLLDLKRKGDAQWLGDIHECREKVTHSAEPLSSLTAGVSCVVRGLSHVK